jgi:hypothetical protein
LPNFSAILPEYSNEEQDVINRAFTTGNFTDLRTTVPTTLKPAQVLRMRDGVQENTRVPTQPTMSVGHYGGSMPKAVNKNGLFIEFEYIPSRFSLAEELAANEHLEKMNARMRISSKDFIPSDSRIRLKNETVASSGEGDEEGMTYPTNAIGNPYWLPTELSKLAAGKEKEKILFGPFVPSAVNEAPLDNITRSHLGDILALIHQTVVEDWEDTEFEVFCNEDDCVCVRFKAKTVATETGLLPYMNTFARTHPICTQYQLKRMVEDWDSKPNDGYRYFSFVPPWVKAAVVAPFFALNPEAAHFGVNRRGGGGD